MKMRSGVLLVGASVVLSACGGGSSGNGTETCVSGIPGLCSTLGVSNGSIGGTTNPSLYTTAPAQVSISPGANAVYTIGGGNGAYTATSSNTNVITASVNGNSLTVVGVAPGTANIAITDTAGDKVTIAVTTVGQALFTTAPERVSITPGNSAVYAIGGGSGPYSATTGNANVATTSLTGNSLTLTGIASGTTNIAITDAAGGKFTIAVDTTGSQPLFTTAAGQVSITPGTSAVYAIGGGNGPYSATSSNTNVATASVSGNSLTVAGIAPGTANIALTDAAGGKVTIAVATTSSQALFTTAPGQVSITPGTSGVYAIGGGNGPYSATSSNTSVAKVKVSGTTLTIDSVTSGKATIAVTDSAGQSVAIDVAFDDPTWSAEPLFITAPTDITLPYAGAVSYLIAGGVPPYTASSSSPTVVAASVNGTSLNITTQWQQSSTSTPATVTVVDAKGHRVQTHVTVLGMGQSGSVPAILPASIIVSDCTTNIPFVVFGGTAPFSVYSGDNVHVPVSAALPFGANWYFTASVLVHSIPAFSATLTVLDSQSKTATVEVSVPSTSLRTCPNNPILEVIAGSSVAKETERISFQIKGGKPPYTITSANYLPNNPRATEDIVSIVEPLNKMVSEVDSNGDYSFVVKALSIANLPTLTGTAMITVTDADGQKKNVVLTVYPQPKP